MLNPNEPVLLEAYTFDTAEFVALSGVTEDDAVNWPMRRIITLGERRADGRRCYSILDAIKARTTDGVSDGVGIKLATAGLVAEKLAADLRTRSKRDAQGRALADYNAFPRGLAYALRRRDGEWIIDTVAIGRGYVDFAGPWGRPHVVVPVAEMVADVLTRILETGFASR